ncbi:MAG: methyltransferase domain-containing protein [Gammaproteobacteria bacterium]|nr:methyltransferase domain-containing protein [Gammaproteobacteria bacterium]MCP5424359.1 methyltransferase domain-containing protein [Gammaproteobacteria bacterium]MCP5459110.1 methyltransferase domain-containing protein [Gammaproteobacteria bacterium]
MTHGKGYVDAGYLQAAGNLLQPMKRRSRDLLRVTVGQSVLDVGCGPGLDTLAMGPLVGPGGCVVGVDADEEMVTAANQRAERAGMSEYVRHQRGEASALALASGRFDACRSERLFIHLPDTRQALAEMIRVTRSGGWLVVVDTDWGTFSIDTEQNRIERLLTRFGAEHLSRNGFAGRQLYRLFKTCGLVDITVELWPVHVLGDVALVKYLTKLDEIEQGALKANLITPEELERWREGLARSENDGTFFASLVMVLVAGRKP